MTSCFEARHESSIMGEQSDVANGHIISACDQGVHNIKINQREVWVVGAEVWGAELDHLFEHIKDLKQQ